MRVIFLDIDGVLNCSDHRRQMLFHGDYSVAIQQHQVARIKKLVEKTDAVIVLISSWRKYWLREGSIDGAGKRIETAFAFEGLSITDKTPVFDNGSRSLEIEHWLKSKPYISQYVILDDNDFSWSRALRKHWVSCPGETGLTDDLIEVAEKILRGNLLQIDDAVNYIEKGSIYRLQKRIAAIFGKDM